MNAKKPGSNERSGEESDFCSVAVVYEDTLIQELAVRLCGRLLAKFGHDLTIQYTWWNFRFLRETEIAELAREEVLKSDVIVFATHAVLDLPLHIQHWVEGWLMEKRGRTGALAALIESSKHSEPPGPAESYIEHAALRADLDYLLLGQGASANGGGSPAQGADHAIVGQSSFFTITPRSSDWGINE